MQEIIDLSRKDGQKKWMDLISKTTPFHPTSPVVDPSDLSEEMLVQVKKDLESSPVPLTIPEIEPFDPIVTAACCRELAQRKEIVELSRPRGRYCSHAVYKALNEIQKFQARN